MSSIENILKKLRESRREYEREEALYEEYEDSNDNDLIALAQEGDQRSFDILLKKYSNFISMMTRKYVPEGTFDRDDIYQLGTIAFWDAVKGYNMTGDFQAYAGMIIKRRMSDELRKLDTDKRRVDRYTVSIDAAESEDDDESGEMTDSEFSSWNAKQSKSPEDELIDNSAVSEIEQFMRDKLSDAERKVVKLYIEGMKMSQIAEVTGMKYKTAENALMRVKNKLVDFLRTRESKKIRESKMIEFSDEEKIILRKALDKIDNDSDIQ